MIQGLRIDHVDGLRDPDVYLRRLRDARPDAWIVVEKILEPRETLPSSWPVDGTTGYDFLAAAGGLFINPASEQALTALHRSFTGERRSHPELRVDAKRLVLTRLFGGHVLVAGEHGHGRKPAAAAALTSLCMVAVLEVARSLY